MPAITDAQNARYRAWLEESVRRAVPAQSAEEVPEGAQAASLARTGKSHRGIAGRQTLRRLIAHAADQAFLDEICEIGGLEHLELHWPVTARDLAPLTRLEKLRVLKIDGPRNITDFSPLCELRALKTLFIENARHMQDLDWIAPLTGRLWSLGIEGSLYTMQKLPSLAPLAGCTAEAMFFTSVQLGDKDLSPLADCPNLKILHCAKFVPPEEFARLAALRPDITCQWFDAA